MAPISTEWLVATGIAGGFVILYPLVLAIVVRRRLGVSWRYFGYGALIFFLFQMITRVPLVLWLNTMLASQLASSALLRYTWFTALALTAGLFEEIGRYIGYRWLMKREEKTWSKAVMYGVGHGGLESMLLVGGITIFTLFNVLALSGIDVNTLPVDQRETLTQQMALIREQPTWFPLLGAWERLWTVPIQIALSVVVVQVFRRGNIGWLWLAVGLHALIDLVAVMVPQLLGQNNTTVLITEGLVAIAGLVGIWAIWRLRDELSEPDPNNESLTVSEGRGSQINY